MSFWDRIPITDLIKLTGSASVSKDQFHLRPGTPPLRMASVGAVPGRLWVALLEWTGSLRTDTALGFVYTPRKWVVTAGLT